MAAENSNRLELAKIKIVYQHLKEHLCFSIPARVTKVKVVFLALVYVFNFDLIEIEAAILEKGLFAGMSAGHFGVDGFCRLWKANIKPEPEFIEF